VIVVDTNVIAYAVLPGEHTEAVLALAEADPAWLAPRLWRSELRNVLATTLRTGRIDLPRAVAAFRQAEALVEDVDVEAATEECLQLAERRGVSAYDAEFVLVAEQAELPFVTADRRLAQAFPKRAVLLEDFDRA